MGRGASCSEADEVAVLFRVRARSVRWERPAAVGATVIFGPVIPAPTPGESALPGVIDRAPRAGIGLVPVGYPFVGVADNVHTAAGTGTEEIVGVILPLMKE